MKQEERKKASITKITSFAFEEFGNKTYAASSMEGICKKGHISKGLIYHYFANKDALFLHCVKIVFANLYAYLLKHRELYESGDIVKDMPQYFLLREKYFAKHPEEKNIFNITTMHCPKHLQKTVKDLRRPLIELNHEVLFNNRSNHPIRAGLKEEDVNRYLDIWEHFMRDFTELYIGDAKDDELHAFFKGAGEILDMLLFGVLKV